MKIALAVLTALAFVAEPGRARGQDGAANSGSAPANQPAPPTLQAQEPAPAPTLAPATNPSLPAYAPPAYGYPPVYYPYPPGYAYPAAPAYPPGNPQYPPAYQQSPYEQPTVVEPAQPVAMGKWRLGVAGISFGQGILSYKLSLPGGDALAYSGNAAATLGLAPFAQFQATRYLFMGFSMQYIAQVGWAAISSATTNGLYNGSGSELDFLPQLGVTIPVAPRLHLLTFGAVGYSLVFASHLVTGYADPGTARGLLFQTGVGLLYAWERLGFLELRGFYQWGYQNSQFQSPNNGETAAIEVHSQYFGLQAGGGFWF